MIEENITIGTKIKSPTGAMKINKQKRILFLQEQMNSAENEIKELQELIKDLKKDARGPQGNNIQIEQIQSQISLIEDEASKYNDELEKI
jgi:chromosome segregation ATPase